MVWRDLWLNPGFLNHWWTLYPLAQWARSKNLSAKNRNKKIYQVQTKKQRLNFKSNNTESYSLPFTITELNESFKKAHDTAVGPDNIHYQFLKQLPNKPLQLLLKLLNNIWTNDDFLDLWRQSFIIPILKPGKDDSEPGNYGLIMYEQNYGKNV